jgi:hypothetical protein
MSRAEQKEAGWHSAGSSRCELHLNVSSVAGANMDFSTRLPAQVLLT